MSLLRKTEDIFKPAKPSEIDRRRVDKIESDRVIDSEVLSRIDLRHYDGDTCPFCGYKHGNPQRYRSLNMDFYPQEIIVTKQCNECDKRYDEVFWIRELAQKDSLVPRGGLEEDIFKPADPEEIKGRKALEKERIREKNKQLLANLERAECPKCHSPIKTSGITEVWSGYATIAQNYVWDDEHLQWVSVGDHDDDYGDGESEYRCTECDEEINFHELDIPDMGGLDI